MNTRSDLDDLKSRIDLSAVIRQSGVDLRPVGKNLMGLCPFHEDQTPSLSVNGSLWNCFGCEAGGDVLSWLQLKEKLEFSQARERLAELALALPATPKANGKTPPSSLAPELLKRFAGLYHQRFKESPEAQEYLKNRGLGSKELWEQFQVGYCDGSLAATIPSNGPSYEAMLELGLLNAKGREHFKGCIVVPLQHPEEGFVGFYGRKIGADKVQHLYLPGPKRGVLQWQSLKQARRVVVAESVLDAFSLWVAGVKDVTCLYGASHLHKDLEALLARFATPEVVFCLDGDGAGQAAAKLHGQVLEERGIHCLSVHLPQGKDPNDLLREQGPQALKERVLSARPLVVEAPAPVVEPQNHFDEEGFVVILDGVRYQAMMTGATNGKLKCNLMASKADRFFSEKLDLFSNRVRMLTAGQMVRILDISRIEAERHLSRLAQLGVDWLQERNQREKDAQRLKAPELTDSEKDSALSWLREPNLIDSILLDCQALGFVGEEKSKLLAYLIGLSRKLPKPLSGIVISQSGAGKSTLTEMVEMLTPPEDVLLYSRLTPAALYYMDHNLTGTLIILEERAGGEAADYSIRTLQTRQVLRLAVPIKDPVTGKITTQTYEVRGPIAYLETTTNPYLNPENASRCFELYMDESEAQTQRIFEQQRRKRLVPEFSPASISEAICKKHHNAQRMLQPLQVYIPYAEKISFPSQWLRTRRDHERFLCLIEAIAFLHQHQRERGETVDGAPYVLANLDDYRLAYELARDVLRFTLHELSREGQDLFERLIDWAKESDPVHPREVVFTLKDIRQRTNLSNHRLRQGMSELVEMEYVALLAGQNGKPFQYSLLSLEMERNALKGLTRPEELEQILRDSF